jgi:hypothetical protein
MRTLIVEHDERRVTICFDSLEPHDDRRIELEIWAPLPREGGIGYSYVRFNGDKQLCEHLGSQGSTLTYRAGTRLVDLVRREYRAMRRDDARRAAKEFTN